MPRAVAGAMFLLTVWTATPGVGVVGVRQEAPASAVRGAEPTIEQIERFLAEARITDARPIGKGVTSPWRLTLSDGTLTHDAAFQSIDRERENVRFRGGRHEQLFRDYYGYNVAAYRLARLLGCDDLVPVTVPREWRRNKGAVTWWIDKKWDEDERLKAGVEPTDRDMWERQVYRARAFTSLVEDTDRNLGNQLVTADFHLWMIDFTRAFRQSHALDRPDYLRKIDRTLYERLGKLTRRDLTDAVKPYLDPEEITALDRRRAALVEHFTRIAAERGEKFVFY